MHIVYIHQYFRTPAQAGGTRSYEFARRLVARGHAVDVLTTCSVAECEVQHPPGSWITTHEGGATVHWCVIDYANEMSYARRLRAFGEFALRALVRVRHLRRDVVLATSTPLTVSVPGVVGARTGRVPLVFEVRDVWPEVPIALGALRRPWTRGAARALEAWAYRHAAQVIALSPDMAASIERRFPGVPVTVVPNSSDVELFAVPPEAGAAFRARRPWLGDRPLVVYTGTFGLVNGLSYVVSAAAAMRGIDPDIRFLLVGHGREEQELRAEAARAGVLGVNLVIEPSIPKEDVPALLSAADLCTSFTIDVPELAASSPNKAFDAFAAGRPLLINHGGWLADVIRRAGAGLVVPPDDPGRAAAEIAAHLRDAAWVRSARAGARLLAESRFDRDLLFEDFAAVIDAAAGARGTEPARTGKEA